MWKTPNAKGSWEEFAEKVSKAKPRKKRNMSEAQLANLWHDPPHNPPPEERQCQAVTRRLGRRCKQWAVRGAKRCHLHGGLREVPTHPATIRAYQKGLVDAETAKRAARDWLSNNVSQRDRQELVETLRHNDIRCDPVTMKQGWDAMVIDDGGRAWRRFLATAPKRD